MKGFEEKYTDRAQEPEPLAHAPPGSLELIAESA